MTSDLLRKLEAVRRAIQADHGLLEVDLIDGATYRRRAHTMYLIKAQLHRELGDTHQAEAAQKMAAAALATGEAPND